MTDRLTRHARLRKQQRSVPNVIIDWLMSYGTRLTQDGGGLMVWDKPARRRLRRRLGRRIYKKVEDFLDVYVALAEDGSIATVGHHYKKFRRT